MGLNAQDVTFKTGNSPSEGIFSFQNSSGTQLIKIGKTLTGEASFHIGTSENSLGTSNVWELDVQTESLGPYVSFSNFQNGGSMPNLWFHKAKGNGGTIDNNQKLGQISFLGYADTDWKEAVRIETLADGDVADGVGGIFKLWTATSTGTQTERLRITQNGEYYLYGLDNDAEGYVKVNEDGKLFYSASKAPDYKSLNDEVNQLKEENQALKAQLKALSDKVDELISNQ